MPRTKKPEGETAAEAVVRRELESVADTATRSEKVSWDRKMDNMIALLAQLRPIEDEILDLMTKKMPILDQVAELRKEMVRTCVHPYTHLVHHDEYVLCKFCERKLSVKAQ